jgi:hypothetical protein
MPALRQLTPSLVVFVLATGVAEPALAREPVSVRSCSLRSLRGTLRLWRAEKAPFRQMRKVFEYQRPSMCGPTSAAVVLNAIEGRRRHTQNSFLAESGRTWEQVRGQVPITRGGKPVYERGFSLVDLGQIIGRQHRTETTLLSRSTPAGRVKADLIGALSRKGTYVIANFDRRPLGQEGRGHFAPLGAYHARSDSFLVMDVNRKRGWTWIDADSLINAMRGHDRGYLKVSAP